MIEYLKTLVALKADRRAVTALEYGIIAGVLAVGIVTAFQTLTGGLTSAFADIASHI